MVDSVRLVFDKTGESPDNILSYSISSDFTTACDAFEFELFSDANHARLLKQTVPVKTLVSVYVNERLQLTGRIDSREISDDGVITIHGRDYISGLTGGYVNPSKVKWKHGMSLEAAILLACKSYGISELLESNNDWRAEQTGTPGYQGSPSKDFRKATLSEQKPECNSGVFESINRVAGLQGYTIQPTDKRNSLSLCVPEFRQAPLYKFTKNRNGIGNNVLSGSSLENWSDVPTFALVKKKVGRSREKYTDAKQELQIFNPNDPENPFAPLVKLQRILDIVSDPNDPAVISFLFEPASVAQGNNGLLYRPIIVEAKDAKNAEEVTNTTKRIVAEKLKDVLVYRVRVAGHSQAGFNFAVDTMCSVADEVCGIFENMWVMSRKFSGSGSSDQVTELELILPYSYFF